jgi:hypothetical protein
MGDGLKLRSFWHGVRSCFCCPESVLQYTRNFIAMSPPLGFLGLSNRTSVFISRPANIFQSDGHEENNERTTGYRVAGMQRTCVFRQRGPEGEGDTSPDPIQSVLPRVIGATNRVLISNGDLDMSIIADGTLLAIPNMCWGGEPDFQSQPNTSIVITLLDLQYAATFEANNGPGLEDRRELWGANTVS